MQRGGLAAVGHSILMVIAAICISAISSGLIRTLAAPWLLKSYTERFNFVPGHWFGQHIAGLSQGADKCVFLGTSDTREGFDPQLFNRLVPSINFINAATTGGNNEVLEVQSSILRSYSIKPHCVIIGVNLWMMFRNGSPSLVSDEYLGLMGWKDVLGLASHPLLTDEGPRIAISLTLPLRSSALQLNRVVRRWIYKICTAAHAQLPLARFEAYPGELKAPDDYFYLHTPPHLFRDWGELTKETIPFYSPGRYGGVIQEQSMRNTLDTLLGNGGRVILVLTPQTPILDPASVQGAPAVRRLLAAYGPKLTTIDCSSLRDLKLFVDEAHLNAEGRAIMSLEVAALVNALLVGHTPPVQPHCRIKSL